MFNRIIFVFQSCNGLVGQTIRKKGFLDVFNYFQSVSSISTKPPEKKREEKSVKDLSAFKAGNTGEVQTSHDTTFISEKIIEEPLFPEVIHEKETRVGFWKTEKGLQLKDTIYTGLGRFARIFVSEENYDNHWERALSRETCVLDYNNVMEKEILLRDGPEAALCYIAFKLGGAVKLVIDDRWVDNPRNLRVPSKKDCTVEAVDMRKTALNYAGMDYFDRAGYIRYLNVADCKNFDNHCMTRLHTLSHSLEYLDISGTAVTPEAFSYLRLFPKLKWINVSRLSNEKLVKSVLPYIREIVPCDCVVTCSDNYPSDVFGTEIPFRAPNNPSKDLILEVDPGIGDVVMFATKYGYMPSEVDDPSVIHQLWKTPLIHNRRDLTIRLHHPKSNMRQKTVVKYLYKAEQYKPLL